VNTTAIVMKLASDRKFRDEFFANPRQAISRAGLRATEDEIQEIEMFDWSNLHCSETSFRDEEIKRCSVDP